jgi:hypothetical protein
MIENEALNKINAEKAAAANKERGEAKKMSVSSLMKKKTTSNNA